MTPPRRTLGLHAYRVATHAATALVPHLVERRRRRGKEDPQRVGERLGIAGRARPEGPLLWMHAASVGESLAGLSLLHPMLGERAGLHALMTTGTVTSAALMGERLPSRAIHQYGPYDGPLYVRRFLRHWRPDAAIWIESELWPNMILDAADSGTVMALVNARMSDKSFARWSQARGAAAALLARFRTVLAQDPDTGERFRRLGARDVVVTGNIKAGAEPLPADPAALDAFRAMTAGRPIWLAASTHPGEEAMIAAAHARMAATLPDLLTIIVPRHPERGPILAAELAGTGIGIARRGAGETVGPQTGLYLADTLGELGLFYRVASVAFVGGSLVPHGGQNPLEPARLGTPVVHGPYVHNFAVLYDALDGARGAVTVADADALADCVVSLLRDADARAGLPARAAEIEARERGALTLAREALEPLLTEAFGARA